MTTRTKAELKTRATTLIDKTGSGGTTGEEIESLIHDIADSAVFPADSVSVLGETSTAKIMTGTERTKLAIPSNADLTKLASMAATATELNHIVGVTSSIQGQLDNALSAADGTALTDNGTVLSTDKIIVLKTSDSRNPYERAVASFLDDVGFGTGDSPQFTAVNLGHATDTTLSRAAAGQLAVEGVQVATASNTLTLTNKSMDAAQLTGTVALARLAALVSADDNNTLTGAPKFWVGTEANYNALGAYDPQTIYIVVP